MAGGGRPDLWPGEKKLPAAQAGSRHACDAPRGTSRSRGRHNIQALRGPHPAKLGFTIRRILGSGDLWITEYVLSYNEQPTQTVSIMEFRDGKVAHETQYFADPFEPPAWRAQWVEHQEK